MGIDYNKEYLDIKKLLEEQDANEIDNYDNLSNKYCVSCGARLLVDEFEEFEDMCSECVHQETSGIIDDDGGELDFDK